RARSGLLGKAQCGMTWRLRARRRQAWLICRTRLCRRQQTAGLPELLMPLLAALAAALSWLGRQGTRAVAASIFIGIMVPPLAALLKPVFAYALFVLLCLAFLRVDPTEVRAHFSRPMVVGAAAAWMMLGTPLLIGLSLLALGMSERLPG